MSSANNIDVDSPSSSNESTPEVEEVCVICMEPITIKRTLTLLPCQHTFHRTCIRRWLETKKSESRQTCPVCRTRTLGDEEDNVRCLPFGRSQQPTRHFVFGLASRIDTASIQAILGFLLAKVSTELDAIRAQAAFYNGQYTEIFIDDVIEEVFLLERREAIYIEMGHLLNAGGMTCDLRTRRPWCYACEYEEVNDIDTEWNFTAAAPATHIYHPLYESDSSSDEDSEYEDEEEDEAEASTPENTA